MLCSRCGEGDREVRPDGTLAPYCDACLARPREDWAAWQAAEADRRRARSNAHRALRAGVFESYIDPWPTTCGRCGCPLDPRYGKGTHHPLAETIGHEPPLSWARSHGVDAVTVRPEHWACNSWQQADPDDLRPAVPAWLHEGHGCDHDQTPPDKRHARSEGPISRRRAEHIRVLGLLGLTEYMAGWIDLADGWSDEPLAARVKRWRARLRELGPAPREALEYAASLTDRRRTRERNGVFCGDLRDEAFFVCLYYWDPKNQACDLERRTGGFHANSPYRRWYESQHGPLDPP